MKTALSTALMILALHTLCHAQNFPDRVVNYDPLGDHGIDTAEFTWLGGARLHAEFGRYSNRSGRSHRWDAKTGGLIELARWDSTWSIALAGTTEITIDPNNDISFNPRAICWEEGVLVSHRLADGAAIQFGGFQRCKHDIDNLESTFDGGVPQERTLIFSGATLRLLLRPRPLLAGSDLLRGGLALRNELYVHILDSRVSGEADHGGRGLDGMVATQVVIGRLDLRPWRSAGIHLSGSVMASWFGERFGILGIDAGRFTILGSIPHLELGLDLFNTHGGSFTLFARGEWQRDAAILAKPQPATLALFGVRFGDFGTMW